MTTLVLLPGMDGTGEMFAPLLGQLAPAIETVVVRYPDRAATYGQHEEAARRELPRGRPFFLLGESFSGPVAVSIAATKPANLRGLILCASFLTSPHRLLRPLRALTPFVNPKIMPGFLAHHALMGPFATPTLRAAHDRALGHVSSPTLTARLRAMATIDLRKELHALEIPVLYLRAIRDRVVSRRFAEEVASHARYGAVVDLDGPHLLLQTRPAECAREIEHFVSAN